MGEKPAGHTHGKHQGGAGLPDFFTPSALSQSTWVSEHGAAVPFSIVSWAINAWHALGSRKYALTPSTAMISQHQQESPVAKQLMLQSCSSESGEVSAEKAAGGSAMPKMLEVTSRFPLLWDTRCWWQPLCTWGGFLHKDGLGLFKPNPKGVCHPQGSLP